jgi:hypothetical protein
VADANAVAAASPRPGPATAVIPRAAGPLGKRQTRARTQTFATHVALDELLERAAVSDRAPSAPPDDPPGNAADAARGDDARDDAHDDAHERDDPTPVRPRSASTPPPDQLRPYGPQLPIQLPGRGAPTAALLLIAGIGAFGLAGGAVYVFFNGRAAVLRSDLPPPDAHVFYVEPDDAATDGTTDGTIDGIDDAVAPPADAGTPAHDAAPRIAAPDARTGPVPRDAGIRLLPRLDARGPGPLTTPLDATPARATGTATLTIGANPWGNVLLDGKKIGRTPIERLSVPAGHHVIEVVFGGEDPPRTLRYPVDLRDGETKDVLADFTRP